MGHLTRATQLPVPGSLVFFVVPSAPIPLAFTAPLQAAYRLARLARLLAEFKADPKEEP